MNELYFTGDVFNDKQTVLIVRSIEWINIQIFNLYNFQNFRIGLKLFNTCTPFQYYVFD